MAEQVTSETESRARIVRAAALRVGAKLEAMRLLDKKIWQLQMSELESVVEASISAFLVEEASERQRRESEVLPESSFAG